MILSIQDRLRHWLHLAVYGSGAGSIAHRFQRRCDSPAIHETAEYWNQELSGRMSEPNINGRIGNAIRDMTSVLLIQQCGPPPRTVLDLGCGFGALAQALAGVGLQRYIGVDLSDYVIERAKSQCSSWPVARQCDLSFHNADLREFVPEDGELFDVIVCNEVLKYVSVDEAVEQLNRYGRWLAPAGVFCVNISDDPKSRAIFRALTKKFTWVYGVVYQQRPDGPGFRITTDDATPAYLVGLFRAPTEQV